MPCSTTQDGRVLVESSDKTWPTGEQNGKLLQCSFLENHINSMNSTTITSVHFHYLKKKHHTHYQSFPIALSRQDLLEEAAFPLLIKYLNVKKQEHCYQQ